MADVLCADMFRKDLSARIFTFWVCYDPVTLEKFPDYRGPLSVDFYGRYFPKHSSGIVRFQNRTNSTKQITDALLTVFDRKVSHQFYIRRLGIAACETMPGQGPLQLDLFTDYEAMEKEKKIRGAMQEIRRRFGTNAVLRGMNLMESGTAKERNEQIGGHKA
jgi:DNA polymerase V